MILLTSTSDKLQVVTGQAVTVDVHASWVDNAAGTITPGSTESAIVAAASTDVVAAPAASTQRNVQTFFARNKHASSSNAITVNKVTGAGTFQLFSVTLLAGELLQFVDSGGWTVFDASGAQKRSGQVGRYLRTTALTSGTSYTTGNDCNKIFVRVQAGGGAGGGCTSVASAASAGGGGAAGGYAEKTFAVTPNTAYAYTIGAAGTGVSGAGGNAGGNSTFVVSGVTVTAFGGPGAPVATAMASLTSYKGGTSPSLSTNGDVNDSGAPGHPGVTLIVATPIVASGAGGSSIFGGGGVGLAGVGTGTAGTGFGSGGAGGGTGASAARAGGNGTGGIILVDEFA